MLRAGLRTTLRFGLLKKLCDLVSDSINRGMLDSLFNDSHKLHTFFLNSSAIYLLIKKFFKFSKIGVTVKLT
jgi:hypothetical protein